ncbi:hypothetical protein C9994_02105 [Marivirga lumbricoides]|uniref:Transporter n=1 Tax=Marivirga lumbricoides TaxID=1046115 RepID=A0A2T4DV32_9BACT|nr:hypothetical protein C9994_02105 [Marivirga lumbricoides]
MKRLLLTILLLIPYFLLAQTENTEPVINTDRPGASDASRTVPKGYLHIESGFLFSVESINPSQEQQLINFNNTLIRYGLLKGLELRLNQSILSSRILENGQEIGVGWQSGLAPLMLGLKVNLTDENGLLPETALVAEVNLPKGNGNFQQENFIYRFNLTALNHLNPDWLLIYNLGIFQSFADESTQFNYTLRSSYTFDKYTPFLEFYGNRSKNTTPLNYINGGISYLVNNQFQLDAYAGIDIVSLYNEALEYNQSFVSVGLGYMFPIKK